MSNVSMVDGHIDRPMTNYERIKNMSVEEMAKFITIIKENCTKDTLLSLGMNEKVFNTLIKGVEVETKQWLESEAI